MTDIERIERSENAPFVLSVTDSTDNELKIILALAKIDRTGIHKGDNAKLNEILENAVPVQADEDDLYEIVFERYIIYQCRNESYTAFDDKEIRYGKYLVTFEKSRLLDFYENVIFDFDSIDTKTKRKHYGIISANHIIDVIANELPIITKINGR